MKESTCIILSIKCCLLSKLGLSYALLITNGRHRSCCGSISITTVLYPCTCMLSL